MKRALRHIRVGFAGVVATLMITFPVYAAATTAPNMTVVKIPDIFITEFQTNGGSATQEFIELYNATDEDIDLGDGVSPGSSWRLQFFNSTSVKLGLPNWSTLPTASSSILLKGSISAHDYFLVASTDYKPLGATPDQTYDASGSHLMTDTGGGLQLLSTTDSASPNWTVHDRIMWLDATSNQTLPGGVLQRPGTGKSQQRIPNLDQEYYDANGGLTTFDIKDEPTPLSAWVDPTPAGPMTPSPVPGPTNTPSDSSLADDPSTSEPNTETGSIPVDTAPATEPTVPKLDNQLSQPLVTELLPNPASPLTDAADEFIEIYNPNQTALELKDYTLEVGTSTLHSFTFSESTLIAPLSYHAFYSRDTKLSLSNSGGQARLKDPTGSTVSESAIYGTAVDNTSWTLTSGLWQWSTTPTPDAANILTTSPSKAVLPETTAASASKVVKKASPSKVSTKSTTKSATKTSAAKGKTTIKKAKATAAKKKSTAKKVSTASAASFTKPKPPIHTGILVAVGGLAVLYGLYEYRHDFANTIARFRGHRKAGRSDRRQIAWQ